jgi:cytoskeletal protein RodZ|tara:strand:- start:384 stop:629 length:246 start_codon:yes stop_codon:yes gene_type:complete
MATNIKEGFVLVMITEAREVGFENIWQIVVTIIIVGLSVVMPIFYYYQRKKNTKQETESIETVQIKEYGNKINEETRNKYK